MIFESMRDTTARPRAGAVDRFSVAEAFQCARLETFQRKAIAFRQLIDCRLVEQHIARFGVLLEALRANDGLASNHLFADEVTKADAG